jgi:two-component system sensor histidine kinase KdpD
MVSSRLTVCLTVIGVATYALFSLLNVNALVSGFTYLLIVLVIAARWGLLESSVTSLAAVICLNFFFLPPILTFTIADPQNWVALFVFMATGITASQLSAKARHRTLEAQARKTEVERLYELSRSLMVLNSRSDVGALIADAVMQNFGFTTVAFCSDPLGHIDFAGSPHPKLEQEILRDIASNCDYRFLWRKKSTPDEEIVVAPITLGGKVIGSIGAVGPPVSEPAWQAVANLAGITVERLRNQAATSRIEAARQSESLKSLLLDALAHEFLTPLTSIKGAVTTVRSEYRHDPEEEDLLAVVEEESDKLNGMVNETIDMARVETGRFQIRLSRLPICDFINGSLDRMASLLDGRLAQVQIPESMSPISADADLAGLALRQLVGNAVKYSPPASRIEISATESNGMIIVNVFDEGPGIPLNEIEVIFDRYYRSASAQDSVPGTGMGLSIARDIISAHGGRIWAENRPGKGARFAFTLPVADVRDRQ